MTKPNTYAETVNDIAQEIRKLEAEIVADRSDYARQALASVRASTPGEREAAKDAAAACNRRVQDNRVTIEGLKVALEEAQRQLHAMRVANAGQKLRGLLQSSGRDLLLRQQAAERAQALVRQAAAAVAEVLFLGRRAHGTFRQFLSPDQSAWIDPDESVIAYAVVGELLRAGAINPGALEELSSMGLSGLFSNQSLETTVEYQNTLMASRFDAVLLEPPAVEAVGAGSSRTRRGAAK